jgi:hypothetical protein
MLICVPHVELIDATRIFLSWYDEHTPDSVKYFQLSEDPWSYVDYLQARWDEGRSFINLEHDVVPWPGSPERLWACLKPWCVHGYRIKLETPCAPFGFVKFTDSLIGTLPNVWQDMSLMLHNDLPHDAWAHADSWFYNYATKRGIQPHTHLPSVLNANPRYLSRPRPGP